MTQLFQFLAFALAVVIGAGCCPNQIIAPQVVNTAPLEAARVSPNIGSILPLFPRREETIVSGGRHADGAVNPSGIVEWVRLNPLGVGWGLEGINVEVRLYRSNEAAFKDFQSWLQFAREKCVVRGPPGDLCAVSDCRRYRIGADAPFSCGHGGYQSFVMFQKGKLVISIDENSPDPGGPRKARVLEELAATLIRAEPALKLSLVNSPSSMSAP